MMNLPNMLAGALNRDFQTILPDLRRMIPQVAPGWTYTGDDDFGIVLLQFAAYLSDHLHHRADAVMRDVVPTRSPQLDIVREFAEWLGYLARGATSAEVDVTFSVPAALTDDLLIPRLTHVTGDGPEGSVTFETTEEVVLPAGVTSVTAHAAEGVTRLDVILGYATGRPNERFTIPDLDCLFAWRGEDMTVTVNGVEAVYSRYPALLVPTVLGYWVHRSPLGALELRFGDGVYGQTLPQGAVIRCTYRRGGGPVGNVGAGAITTVLETFRLNGALVDLRVTNASAAAPGLTAEDADSIRALAPANFRAQERAVTEEDYSTLARRVPGVFQARITPSGVNGVVVSIVPTGLQQGVRVSDALIRRMVRFFDTYKMATDSLTAKAARLVTLDVSLRIRAKRNALNSACTESVRQRFVGADGMFSQNANALGRTLWQSDMIGDLEKLPLLENLDVLRYCRRPTIQWTVASGDADLAPPGVTLSVTTTPQVWTIEFISATEFLVTGEESGEQETVGQLDVAYNIADEISFKIASGTTSMSEGDRGEIIVGALAGNIYLAPDEFPIFDARSVTIRTSGGVGP